MKVILYKSKPGLQLFFIFCGAALLMAAYEFAKEWTFKGSLTDWESHSITIFITAAFATVAGWMMRNWVNKVNEQLNVATVAFESQDGMIITDAKNKILRVNRAFTEITGYTDQEAIGQTPGMLSSGLHDSAFYAEMWECIRNTGSWQGEIFNRRKNGEIYPERLSITAVKGTDGRITNYIGVLVDEQVRHLAFYDPLTGLPNRRLLVDRINQAMVASKRSGQYGAVMFMDMDNFKTLNDTQGHDAGDMLLSEVANRIKHCVREMDTVARIGGDEFVVVLRELSMDMEKSRKQAGIIAEKIRAALAQPYVLTIQSRTDSKDSIEHRCSSSIGVALFFDHIPDADDIIKQSDVAMYQAKREGRNLVRFYDANNA